MNKLKHTDIIRRWLVTLPHSSVDKCLGYDMEMLLFAIDNFALERLPDYGQTLWEFPLCGSPHCDISFCYNKQTMAQNIFLHEEGRKIEPLLWHLFKLTPDVDVWSEVDIPDTEDAFKIPAVFLNVKDDAQIIFDRTWAQGSEPPQWEKAKNICLRLHSGWKMHYIGLMPGRKNNPLRLIFKRSELNDVTEQACLEDVQGLLKDVGFSVLPEDAKIKLKHLEQLGFKEWEISFDLYPDNSFGKVLGVEIALVEDGVNPIQLTNTSKWQNLQNSMLQWGLADERMDEIKSLLGSEKLQFLGETTHAFIYTFLSHIKLRWDGEIQLPAKAYLTHNYELHE